MTITYITQCQCDEGCTQALDGHRDMTLPAQKDAASMARKITDDPAYQGILRSDFLYGCSSASHQIEGGYLQDGKGLGIWDKYLESQDNGQVACDSYNMWREDVRLLKSYGCTTYRFSVAWPRVKPQGKSSIFESSLSGAYDRWIG